MSAYSVNAATSTNAAVIKANRGAIHSIVVNNAAVAARFLRFYNLNTVPTVGTNIPEVVITVPASSSKEIAFPQGLIFSNGIGVAITGAAAANDATAVAAGDVQLNVNFV